MAYSEGELKNDDEASPYFRPLGVANTSGFYICILYCRIHL